MMQERDVRIATTMFQTRWNRTLYRSGGLDFRSKENGS